MLPTGNAKTALFPAILGDEAGRGAPIEHEHEGGMVSERHEKERKYTAAKMENNIETKAEEENGTKNYDANSQANCATQTVDRLGRAAQSIG